MTGLLDIVSAEEVSRGLNVNVNVNVCVCVGSGVAVASRQKALLLDQINSRGSQYNFSVSVADSGVHHTTFFVGEGVKKVREPTLTLTRSSRSWQVRSSRDIPRSQSPRSIASAATPAQHLPHRWPAREPVHLGSHARPLVASLIPSISRDRSLLIPRGRSLARLDSRAALESTPAPIQSRSPSDPLASFARVLAQTMGRLYKVYLSGQLYTCSTCNTHLALKNHIISKVSLALARAISDVARAIKSNTMHTHAHTRTLLPGGSLGVPRPPWQGLSLQGVVRRARHEPSHAFTE